MLLEPRKVGVIQLTLVFSVDLIGIQLRPINLKNLPVGTHLRQVLESISSDLPSLMGDCLVDGELSPMGYLLLSDGILATVGIPTFIAQSFLMRFLRDETTL